MEGTIGGRTASSMPGLDIAEQRAWQHFLDAALRLHATLNRELVDGHGLTLNANAFGRFVQSTEFNSNFDGPDTLWLSRSAQFGATAQLEHTIPFGALENHLVLGAEYTHNTINARLSAGPELTTILAGTQNAPRA